MAASQRVQILSDKSAELSLLLEFIQNPDLIKNLSDEVKKLNSLTSEEEKMAFEGRELINKREKILQEINDKKEELAKVQAVHDKQFSILFDKEKALSEAQEDLNKKNQERLEVERYLTASKDALEKEKNKIKEILISERENLSAEAAKVNAQKLANEAEKNRLVELEKDLKDKADKIRELVGA